MWKKIEDREWKARYKMWGKLGIKYEGKMENGVEQKLREKIQEKIEKKKKNFFQRIKKGGFRENYEHIRHSRKS